MRWNLWYFSVRKLSYCANKMSQQAPSVPWVCQEGSDQGLVQELRSRHTRRQLFSLKGSEGGQPGRHRSAQEEKMLNLNGKSATVQISELWALKHSQSLVFSVWRDGSGIFNYIEKHQQRKNSLWLPCSFILLS